MIREAKLKTGLVFLLVLLACAAFGQVLGFEFLNLDDDHYLTKNPALEIWGSLEGIRWAFTYTGTGNWHPLVWISLMGDYLLFGLNPTGFHAVNLLLHLLTGILLFRWLCTITESTWKAFFVAALFLIHPLRVESVAWISERKDVLSGLFFMLTLMTYMQYARGVRTGCPKNSPTLLYFATLLMFGLGLLSKTMLVTTPFVLLLIDFWPLNRFTQPEDSIRCVTEKIPFFILSLLAASMAVISRVDLALYMNEQIPLATRLLNSVAFYGDYLEKTIIPRDLTFYYPYPVQGVNTKILGVSGLVLFLTTVAVILKRKTMPYLLVGWLWFLGMLVPVIGWVKIGSSAINDRYTYLPHIGLFIMMIYGMTSLFGRGKKFNLRILGCLAGLVVLLFTGMSYQQASHWQSNEKLYRHALRVNPDNFLAHMNYGIDLKKRENYSVAMKHFRQARQIRRRDVEPLYMIGAVHYQSGNREDALRVLKQVVGKKDDFTKAHEILGEIYGEAGQSDQSIKHYEKALTPDNPDRASVHFNLGNQWMRNKDLTRAKSHYLASIELEPTHIKALTNLGNLHVLEKNYKRGEELFRRVLRMSPSDQNAHLNLAILYALQERKMETERHFKRFKELAPATEISPQKREILGQVLDLPAES